MSTIKKSALKSALSTFEYSQRVLIMAFLAVASDIHNGGDGTFCDKPTEKGGE